MHTSIPQKCNSFITHQSTKCFQSPRISMTYCKFLILPALFSISFHTCNTSFGIFQFYSQTLKFFLSQFRSSLSLWQDVISGKNLRMIIRKKLFWSFPSISFYISRSFFVAKYVISFLRFLKTEYSENI